MGKMLDTETGEIADRILREFLAEREQTPEPEPDDDEPDEDLRPCLL